MLVEAYIVNKGWFHFIWIILLGYLLGYYWPGLAKMTVGKFLPAKG